MKRMGYLFETIISKENIDLAIQNAAKGKRNKRKTKKLVSWVLRNKDEFIEEIQQKLKDKTYRVSPYKEAKLYDRANKKERIIYKPKFYPDQIVHWALMQVIKPILSRGMYKYSGASIPKRGTLYIKKYIQKAIINDKKNTKYILKLDIKKFYPSIDKEILKNKFRKVIKDKETLWLMDLIVDNSTQGLPIGNYTSQWFANFYLQELDHFIKETLKIKYYARYMDDLVLFSPNLRELRKKFKLLKIKIGSENLKIKENWQIFPLDKRPLDFCGFVFTRDKILIRKRITKNMRRRYFKFNKEHSKRNAQSLLSYYGYIKHTNSYILKRKYINLKQLKESLK